MKSLLEHLEAEGEVFSPKLRSAFRALEGRVVELEALVRSQAEEIRELKRRLVPVPVQERMRVCLEQGQGCGVSRIRKNCQQLLALWPALWTFAQHPDVEPTSSPVHACVQRHNETERTLRAGVIWRKTSFGSQSGRGMRLVERFLTVAETCKKQGRDLLGFLTTSLQAHHGAGPYPRLLPTP